jgi:hypothetical protein
MTRKLIFLVALIIALELLPRPAQAIIGMPWTPMSYAGVARRTTRRAVIFGGAAAAGAYGAYGAYPVAAPPAYVAPPPYAAPTYVAPPAPVVVW